MRWNQLGKTRYCRIFKIFFYSLRTPPNEELRTLNLKCQNMLFQAAVIHIDLHPVFHRNQNNMF